MQTQALGWEGRQRQAWKSDEGRSGGGREGVEGRRLR